MTPLPRPALLGAAAILLVVAGTAVAVPTVYRIEIAHANGFAASFTDPAGFACRVGASPQHAPPSSIERRCTPRFAVSTCSAPSVETSVVGAPGATGQVNGSCDAGARGGSPVAACSASVRGFSLTANCTDGPGGGSVDWPFEFICHAPVSGVWIQHRTICEVTIG